MDRPTSSAARTARTRPCPDAGGDHQLRVLHADRRRGGRLGRQRRGSHDGRHARRGSVRRAPARRRSPATPGRSPTLELGAGAPVQVGLLANANTLAVSGGELHHRVASSATSCAAWRRLANLSSSQANDTGFAALVQDTRTSLSGAIGAMGIEAGALGDIQSSLKATQSAGVGHEHGADGPGLVGGGRGHGQDAVGPVRRRRRS